MQVLLEALYVDTVTIWDICSTHTAKYLKAMPHLHAARAARTKMPKFACAVRTYTKDWELLEQINPRKNVPLSWREFALLDSCIWCWWKPCNKCTHKSWQGFLPGIMPNPVCWKWSQLSFLPCASNSGRPKVATFTGDPFACHNLGGTWENADITYPAYCIAWGRCKILNWEGVAGRDCSAASSISIAEYSGSAGDSSLAMELDACDCEVLPVVS